jgi:crossover junction endodeoxyribonuclease RuvC
MIVLGIDPGANGALAFVQNGHLIEVVDMPTMVVRRGSRDVREVSAPSLGVIMRAHDADAAYIEQVGAMPGQGVSSMFAFGRAVGVLEGVLAACGIPVTKVPPQTWQRAMRVRGGKDGARERAGQLYPRMAQLFERKKDDGRADAALIATYGANELTSL